MKSDFKKQLWWSASVVVVAIVAATVALYMYSGDLSNQEQQIMRANQLAAEQNASVGILATLEGEAPRAAPYLAAFKTLLPTHDELIGFSNWLQNIGAAHHVTTSFSFTGSNVAATNGAPGIDGISLSADGSASDIAAFLQDLEFQAPGFLLSIDTFTLTNQGQNYHLSAQGKLFSQM